MNLNNNGDEVLVLDESDQLVDAVSWGNSDWAFNPDCPVVAEGHSIERNPANADTNTAADWIDQAFPDPGHVHNIYSLRDIGPGGQTGGWLVLAGSMLSAFGYVPARQNTVKMKNLIWVCN